MKLTQSKDLNSLLRSYAKQGWTFETGRRHLIAHSPKGEAVVMPKTPSDRRAIRNIEARLKKTD